MAKPCRKTPFTREHPEFLARHRAFVERVSDLYKEYRPTDYTEQAAVIEKVPRFRLWQTPFSSIYIAKNWQTNFHRDGNLPDALTALTVMGRHEGGELVIARWRIGFALRPGDLLFFDAEQLHGNLPFRGKRLSAAFICARGIGDCGE